MSKGTDLVFTIRVTLPAKWADEYRFYTEDDGTELISSDDEIVSDALQYFGGWHSYSLMETVECNN